MDKVKYCPYCGREVQPDWKVCPYCGHELMAKSVRYTIWPFVLGIITIVLMIAMLIFALRAYPFHEHLVGEMKDVSQFYTYTHLLFSVLSIALALLGVIYSALYWRDGKHVLGGVLAFASSLLFLALSISLCVWVAASISSIGYYNTHAASVFLKNLIYAGYFSIPSLLLLLLTLSTLIRDYWKGKEEQVAQEET